MNENDLWGPIELNRWKEVLHIDKKIATEKDVKEGRAVFFIENNDLEHLPLELEIPSFAYQINSNNQEKIPVVIIQGEKVGDDDVIGVRYLEGGNGICSLSELDFNMPTE